MSRDGESGAPALRGRLPGYALSHIVLQTISEGVVVQDADGAIVAWNPAAERILGLSGDELSGRGAADPRWQAVRPDGSPLPPDSHPPMIALRSGRPVRGAAMGISVAGAGRRWLRVSSEPLPPPDGGVVTTFTDVSDDVRNRSVAETATEQRAILARLAEAVAAEEPADLVFGMAAREAARLIGVPTAFVLRLSSPRRVEVVGRSDPECRPDVGTELPMSNVPLTARIAATGNTGRVDLSRSRSRADGPFRCRHRVGAPVPVEGEVWGTIIAAGAEPDHLPADAESRLGDFAQLVGLAISTLESRDRVVGETAAAIFGEQLDMDATLQAVVEGARRALKADRASCYIHSDGPVPVARVVTTETDPDRRRAIEAAVGMRREDLPLLGPLLESEDPLWVVEDALRDNAMAVAQRRRLGSGAFLGLRLEVGGTSGRRRLLGTLFVSFTEPRRVSARDRRTARGLASLAGVALANARLHEEALTELARAEQRAAVDSLTELANHRTLQDRLRAEFDRATRHGRALSIAILDLDHFKRVNDRHGHQVGDAVLVEVARRLRGIVRKGDTLARVGGEEFAWLMPETDELDAWQAAERAREAVARTPFAEAGLLTMSAGVCDIHQARSADELYRLADGALYWAKAHGRDATYRYTPDVVTVLSADERAEQLERSRAIMSIRLLARVVDTKDPSTRRHSERVADLATRIATALGWPQERIAALHEAALVHDVGKIGIPDAVLFKPGRLTDAEYETVKQHAALGARIVTDVLSDEQVSWVRHHHERFDGRGYPDGLAGDGLPDGARILAVADAWDVMTSVRPYSAPVSIEEALAECRRCAGQQFAPEVVAAVERLYEAGALGPIA